MSKDLRRRGYRRLRILRSGRRRSGSFRGSQRTTQVQASPNCERHDEKHCDRQDETLFRRLFGRRGSTRHLACGGLWNRPDWLRYRHEWFRPRNGQLSWRNGRLSWRNGRLSWRNGRLRHRNARRLWRRFDLGLHLGDGRTFGGIAIQALPCDLRERCRKSGGEGGSVGFIVGPRGRVLSESLHHDYAETPYITGCGKTAVFCFRRIVHGRLRDTCRGLTDGPDGIARQFQLIVDDQNVGWLQPALHQVLAVKEGQGVQRRT